MLGRSAAIPEPAPVISKLFGIITFWPSPLGGRYCRRWSLYACQHGRFDSPRLRTEAWAGASGGCGFQADVRVAPHTVSSGRLHSAADGGPCSSNDELSLTEPAAD
jgi:hypothetical protein